MSTMVEGSKEYTIICSADGGKSWHEVAKDTQVICEDSFLMNSLMISAKGSYPKNDLSWRPREFKLNLDNVSPITFDEFSRLCAPTLSERKWRTRPKRILQHGKATIVWWMDGTKTVVKLHGEDNDPEKALAMALARKVWGRCKTAKYVKRIERGDA